MNLIPWKSRKLTPSLTPSFGNDFTTFQKEMNSLMNSFLGNTALTTPSSFSASWYPSIDLKEKDNKYLLDADVPGLSEADLDIDFHDNVLTIKGESKSETKTSDKDYVCVERSHGSFRREIYLDEEVNKDSIKANLKNGVLHIEMDKLENSSANHKKIAIKH